MTEQDKRSQAFWIARFTEYLHTDAVTKGNDNRAEQAKYFADACLLQYNITFQTAKEQ